MITEIAEFTVKPEERDAFLLSIKQAAEAFLAKSEGYQGHLIFSSHESPARVILQVQWVSIEAHTIGFRQSAAFTQWREIIGPFFQAPPRVEHFDEVTAAR